MNKQNLLDIINFMGDTRTITIIVLVSYFRLNNPFIE